MPKRTARLVPSLPAPRCRRPWTGTPRETVSSRSASPSPARKSSSTRSRRSEPCGVSAGMSARDIFRNIKSPGGLCVPLVTEMARAGRTVLHVHARVMARRSRLAMAHRSVAPAHSINSAQFGAMTRWIFPPSRGAARAAPCPRSAEQAVGPEMGHPSLAQGAHTTFRFPRTLASSAKFPLFAPYRKSEQLRERPRSCVAPQCRYVRPRVHRAKLERC